MDVLKGDHRQLIFLLANRPRPIFDVQSAAQLTAMVNALVPKDIPSSMQEEAPLLRASADNSTILFFTRESTPHDKEDFLTNLRSAYKNATTRMISHGSVGRTAYLIFEYSSHIECDESIDNLVRDFHSLKQNIEEIYRGREGLVNLCNACENRLQNFFQEIQFVISPLKFPQTFNELARVFDQHPAIKNVAIQALKEAFIPLITLFIYSELTSSELPAFKKIVITDTFIIDALKKTLTNDNFELIRSFTNNNKGLQPPLLELLGMKENMVSVFYNKHKDEGHTASVRARLGFIPLSTRDIALFSGNTQGDETEENCCSTYCCSIQ